MEAVIGGYNAKHGKGGYGFLCRFKSAAFFIDKRFLVFSHHPLPGSEREESYRGRFPF